MVKSIIAAVISVSILYEYKALLTSYSHGRGLTINIASEFNKLFHNVICTVHRGVVQRRKTIDIPVKYMALE